MARWIHLELLSVDSVLEGKKRKGKKMMFVVDFSTQRTSLEKELPVMLGADFNGLKLLDNHYNTEQGLWQWDSTRARGGQGRNNHLSEN